MELCCLPRPILSLPRPRPSLITRSRVSLCSSKSSFSFPNPGLGQLRAAASDETSTFVSRELEKPSAPEAVSVDETPSGGEQSELGDFLSKIDVNLDSDKTYILLYGAAALLALWISSAVVGAIESLPLFPKLLELVGLGYTVWFSYRYLFFKVILFLIIIFYCFVLVDQNLYLSCYVIFHYLFPSPTHF
ncbi:Uncharacterized protein AXF42_Ash016835 [Apostasia shenzhenica]|uniref:Cyanobacterial aminoacyl-tRNA synthetase CAAD domain-containing protein n=1 Tax=Apostasia shenzhenica TaxID=1088818 RepID=A0A2I0BAH6_9ASPA|nr:Uncharacterized protein AXF42_Ash016835 [Apostasia shenzhenica]